MFTPDFKKLRVALRSCCDRGSDLRRDQCRPSHPLTVGQSKSDVYPYQDEDWLRYLLPALFENRGYNRIMLVGESAVRENLLYEEFDQAFPKMRTFQGGLSVGTVDDLLISLEYIERVYGRKALPQVLVSGISPRFVANLPAERPFMSALELYSPYYGVEDTPSGPRLKPKSFWEGWFSWLRFVVFKQQKRYLASLSALARNFISMDSMESSRKPLSSGGRFSVPSYGSLSKPYAKSHTRPWQRVIVVGLRLTSIMIFSRCT